MAKDNLLPPFEIFRAGTHVDDAGVERTFSAADLAATAAAYNPSYHEAPLVIGHPEADQPAYGWVASLTVDGDRLIATPSHTDAHLAEMVSARRFAKRSASFYPPGHPKSKPGVWSLRHVGFLGARPPAIPGLRDFAEGDNGEVVSFSEPSGFGDSEAATETIEEEPKLTEKEMEEALAAERAKTAQLEAEKKAAQDKAAAAEQAMANFAEQQRAANHAAVVSFCEGQVQAGKLLPADKPAAIAALDALSQVEPVSFSESAPKTSLAEWLKGLLASAPAKVSFGEFAPGGTVVTQGGAQGLSDAEIDRRAKAYAAEKGVSYADALTAVVSFTQ